jgi:hypothetical protein
MALVTLMLPSQQVCTHTLSLTVLAVAVGCSSARVVVVSGMALLHHADIVLCCI